MRVLVAPDKFAGTLTAAEAADAIAEGWRRRAPSDELDLVPMADGGPGFLEALHASLGGRLEPLVVAGPLGADVPAAVLVVEDTAYVEAAQACGLHLVLPEQRDPERGSTVGVGQLVAAAVDTGVRRVVVGLGGSGTNDGGAGLLAALGAVEAPAGALRGGPHALGALEEVDLGPAMARTSGVELVAATDVDNPLLGLLGATKTYGPQKGLPEERLLAVDAALGRLAERTDRKVALGKGAGAAGGLGFALLLLGARRVPGLDVVAEAVDLPGRATRAELVVTGEGSFDFSTRSGKVPAGVARISAEAVRPCIALAGSVLVGSREMRTMGIESAYSVVDLVGEAQALAEPAASLAALAERVARTWSPPDRQGGE